METIKVDMDVVVWQVNNDAYGKILQMEAAADKGFPISGKVEMGTFGALYHEGKPRELTIDEAPKALEQVKAVKAVITAYGKLPEAQTTRMKSSVSQAIQSLDAFETKLTTFIENGKSAEKVKPGKALVAAVQAASLGMHNYERPDRFDAKHGMTTFHQTADRIASGKPVTKTGFQKDLQVLDEYFSEMKSIIEKGIARLDGVAKDRTAKTAFRDQTADTPQEEARNRAEGCRDDLNKVEAALEAINTQLGKPGAEAARAAGERVGKIPAVSKRV